MSGTTIIAQMFISLNIFYSTGHINNYSMNAYICKHYEGLERKQSLYIVLLYAISLSPNGVWG